MAMIQQNNPTDTSQLDEVQSQIGDIEQKIAALNAENERFQSIASAGDLTAYDIQAWKSLGSELRTLAAERIELLKMEVTLEQEEAAEPSQDQNENPLVNLSFKFSETLIEEFAPDGSVLLNSDDDLSLPTRRRASKNLATAA